MAVSAEWSGVAPSPWGTIRLFSDGEALTRLVLPKSKAVLLPSAPLRDELPIFKAARRELAAYFSGKLRDFTLPFDLAGTEFQAKVWQALLKIPYGKVWSYSDLATRIGQPTATRAVALANARNPLPLIVPCHRVIGKNGALTGYSGGGIARKAALLHLEAESL